MVHETAEVAAQCRELPCRLFGSITRLTCSDGWRSSMGRPLRAKSGRFSTPTHTWGGSSGSGEGGGRGSARVIAIVDVSDQGVEIHPVRDVTSLGLGLMALVGVTVIALRGRPRPGSYEHWRSRLANSALRRQQFPCSSAATVLWPNLNALGDASNCLGRITSIGHNLFGSTQNCAIAGPGTGDLLSLDPLLSPLGDNGGPTATQALQPGSPAIDAGDNAACAAIPVDDHDQRGVPRPIDGNGDLSAVCDIGAVEYVATPADANACKKYGWRAVYRADGSSFKNQGDCIQYVNTGK